MQYIRLYYTIKCTFFNLNAFLMSYILVFINCPQKIPKFFVNIRIF